MGKYLGKHQIFKEISQYYSIRNISNKPYLPIFNVEAKDGECPYKKIGTFCATECGTEGFSVVQVCLSSGL